MSTTLNSDSLPSHTTRSPNHMVASADALATQAGLAILAIGGNAVDAAIATNAAIAVTSPHLCGIGGDLFALVFDSEVSCLNASGRSGSGANAPAMRAAGYAGMPFRHDIRSVTVPGCVDGWIALHERFASMPLALLLAAAIELAEHGFPAGPLLVGSAARVDGLARQTLAELTQQACRTGDRVRRPGVARALRAIADGGRDAFYGGEFGDGLLELGRAADGWFRAEDLQQAQAEWVTPLRAAAWGVDLWTSPPNSQGYLTLGAAALADQLELPADPDDEHWAHLLIEAAKVAGYDRPDVLHSDADGVALLAAIAGRTALVDHQRAGTRSSVARAGDTTYLCTADATGMGVSLIQSNASGFGSWLVEPNTQINLHNRGLGFNLLPGHPAELAPGTRPPHTLSPALATRDNRLAAVFGTMGGDAQPQILLQLAARLFHHRQSPATAMNAGRWALAGPETGFDTWTAPGGPIVEVEGHAPAHWMQRLAARGHSTVARDSYSSDFGHAQIITRDQQGFWAGASDPRAAVGTVAGG